MSKNWLNIGHREFYRSFAMFYSSQNEYSAANIKRYKML